MPNVDLSDVDSRDVDVACDVDSRDVDVDVARGVQFKRQLGDLMARINAAQVRLRLR